jgi:hypothetical protein
MTNPIKMLLQKKSGFLQLESDGGYLTFYLNQPIKRADFRLDALLADTMLIKLYMYNRALNSGINISQKY